MSKTALEKLKQFLKRSERERINKRKKLHKIIKKMHQRQMDLKDELCHTTSPELKEKLRKQIALLKKQQHKGKAVLAELKEKAEQDK